MEFRCRLGTPGGEIIEGIYAADSEARLRREFEDKGLYVLGIQRAGGLALGRIPLPTRARVSTREFLVFNQELATLLKAGMPLVQSLDILRRRVANPLFKSVLDDVQERVRAGSALSEAFEAHGALFPGVYTASLLAGEKSGNLEQVIRRYVAYVKVVATVRRKTISALVYPVILLALSLVVVSIIVLRVVPEFGAFYAQFDRELPLSTRMIVAVSNFARGYFVLILLALAGAVVGLWMWFRHPAQRRAARPLAPAAAGDRADRAEVLDLPGVAHAGDAARRRHSAGQRHRRLGQVDQEPLHRAGAARWRGRRCARGGRSRRR